MSTRSFKLQIKVRKYLKAPYEVKLAEERNYDDVDSGDTMVQTRKGQGGALDTKLRSMLVSLRKEIADKKSLPPYVIFQDISLMRCLFTIQLLKRSC